MRFRTGAAVATLVTACVLLTGCGPGPLDSPFNTGGPGGNATPHQTGAPTSAPTAEPTEQPAEKPNASASCLIGTWEEDMEVFTDTLKTTQGSSEADSGVTNISWTGGAYFRFNQNENFSVWTEDLSVSFDLEGATTRMAVNANGGGGYTIGGDEIRWSNNAHVQTHLRVFEDENLVHEGNDGTFGDFDASTPFTCTKDTLTVNLDAGTLDPPRVFHRIADKNPKN